MHERRDNVLGTDVLGNFRLALECANLNFPTLETFEMALMRSFKLLLTLAREIKQQIRSTTDLTASAGVSYCKFLAKLASDAHKPDGLTVISPEQAPAFLEALSIEKFFGVGKVTAAKLRELGIEHGIDLKGLGEERLRALLGKHGSQLYRFVRGEDDRPVEPRRERKSVGKE